MRGSRTVELVDSALAEGQDKALGPFVLATVERDEGRTRVHVLFGQLNEQ